MVLAETDGSAYLATFSSLPGTWQEVALGLGDFLLMDSTQDENQKLDPQQVAALGFGDVIFLLDTLAKSMPFIMAPDMGPRMLWLDDVRVSTEPVPPRWEVTQVDGKRAVRLDSFEGAPLQWLTIAGAGVEVSYDREHASDGEFSLRMTYNLPEGKTFGAVTNPADAPLAGMKTLRMSMISEAATTLLLELKERDESKYHASVQLTGGSQFQEVEVPLSDFGLADDSTDENGALDIDRISELLFADVSIVAGTPVTTNTLWMDDILFSE